MCPNLARAFFEIYGISHVAKMAVHVERLLFFLLVAVVFQCAQVQIASAVACTFVSGSKCKCSLADNSGEIDLSPLFADGKLSAKEYVHRGVLVVIGRMYSYPLMNCAFLS